MIRDIDFTACKAKQGVCLDSVEQYSEGTRDCDLLGWVFFNVYNGPDAGGGW